MSKIKFIAKQFAISLIFLYTLCGIAYATDNDMSTYHRISADELKDRLGQLSSQVELTYTPEVHSIIDEYIRGYRRGSEVLLGRGGQYFPLYDNELEKAGLPSELKYLSVVESSLLPNAKSQSGAVGLWQFIKSTGQLYGLTINSTVDERKEPIRSTQAATQFLKELYLEFGDWTLALAAYNCGPGGVKKATKRSSEEDYSNFWNIKRYLPKETRRYVPKYIAISYVMNYFQHHGLEPIIEASQEELATVKIYDYTTFTEISNKTGLDKSTIWRLNPAFLKGYIPKSTKGYYLTLPEREMYDYVAMTDNWGNLEYRPNANDDQYYQFLLYGNMKRRAMHLDILEIIPSTEVMILEVKSNDDTNRNPLPPTQTLILDEAYLQQSAQRYKYHKLEAQQSLMDIAEIFNVDIGDLIKLNNIDIYDPPAPGTVIKVEELEVQQ